MKFLNLFCSVLVCFGVLQGCASNTESITDNKLDNAPNELQTKEYSPNEPALRQYGEKLINDLIKTIPPSSFIDKIAIATMVDVTSLEKTDWLGRELAEIFVSSLHNKGFTVVDFKLTGYLEVTEQGDFVFSRNWQKLAAKAKVTRVLSGTMSYSESGVMLYARIVNLKTSMIEGSAEIFIPKEDLPDCYKTYPNTCNVNVLVDKKSSDKGVQAHKAVNVISLQDKNNNNNVYQNNSNISNKNKNQKYELNDSVKQQENINNSSLTSTSSTYLTKNTTLNHQRNNEINNNSSNNVQYNGDSIVKKAPILSQREELPCAKGGNNTPCSYPGTNKTNCHKPCSVPLIYPATSYGVGGKLVRDIGTQSQYDRY